MANVTFEDIAKFDIGDYSIFGLMLLISALIGIYFGCFGTMQKSPAEYLLGGNAMKSVPVGVSLVASHVSGTSLLGMPAEVYTDGSVMILVIISTFFGCLTIAYVFIPVLCNLNLNSAYEYLELRYNRTLRSFASTLIVIYMCLVLPPLLYIPGAALSQVTGVDLHVITSIVIVVCIFYTTIGGYKAVIWTDFFQTVLTLLACMAIVVIGTIDAGGLSHVLKTAYEGGRLNIFNMDPNPFQRNTFWTVLIGTYFSWTASLSSSQSSVQRFLSVPSEKEVRQVLIVYWIGKALLYILCVYGGILVYTVYLGCDPIQQNIVKKPDQIYPYFVVDKIGYVPLLPGLFVAGVFSSALSSLSTFLNTIAGTIYEDYIKRKGVSDNLANIIMKVIILIVGLFAVASVMVMEKLGNVLAVSFTLAGVMGTPIFSMFFMGMIIPRTNHKGALVGAMTGFVVMIWIAIGSAINKVQYPSKDIYPHVPSTCPNSEYVHTYSNSTIQSSPEQQEDEIFILYKLSYVMYKLFGVLISVTVGVIVSYATGPTDLTTLNPRLISPIVRGFLPKSSEITLAEKLPLSDVKSLK